MKFTTDLFPMSYAAFQMIDDNEFPLKGINVLQFFLKQSPAIKDQKRRVVFFYHERLLGLTWEKLRGNGRLPKHDDPSTFDVAQKRSQEKSSDWEVVYK